MKQETFDLLVMEENKKSEAILSAKAKEYAESGGDRLVNFKQCAGARGVNPAEALAGMLVKHFVSVLDMCKNPLNYSDDKWDEKLVDVRNYTYLLKGVITDMKE